MVSDKLCGLPLFGDVGLQEGIGIICFLSKYETKNVPHQTSQLMSN